MRFLVSAFALGVLLCSMSVSSVGTIAQGDGHSPGMAVETTMRLTSMTDLEGTGTLKITFSGEQVRELRECILTRFDTVDRNQIIDEGEAKEVLIALSDTLDGRSYWGVTLSVATDFTNVSLPDMSDWVTGLVYEDLDSALDLSFTMDLECRGQGTSKVILITEGAVHAFVDAFDECFKFVFEGSMHLRHRLVTFGIGSFTYPEVTNGTFQEIRTPAGAVLWYKSDFEVEGLRASTQESISYETFSIMENHQIAFVILLIGTLMIARMPGRRFEAFKKLHPKRYRKYAHPKLSVKLSAVALLAVVWLLYVLPFLFSFAANGFMVYSLYFVFLVPAAIMTEYVVSRHLYEKSALDIPEESVIEVIQALVDSEGEAPEALCNLCYKPIEMIEELHKCEACGTMMHIECADRSQACPSCGGILFPQDTRSIECKVCGESFLHSGMDDPYSIQCTRCGSFQEEVHPSRNYLIIDRDPTMAYRMVRAMGVSDRPAMVMTSEFPGKTRADFGLGEEVDVRWLSDSTTDIDNVDPKDLEGDVMETASTFLMTTKRAGLMVDGIDLLIELNGFERVIAFVKRLNDLAMIHSSSILLFIDKSTIDEEQLKNISDEFDEVHDYL
jgi:hypothetical protein